MIGVVLWSDPQECKAVIWCEDHGDLAFFNNDACSQGCSSHDLDAGDLVEFDVEISRKLRYAHNPRLLQEGACSNLTDVLAAQRSNAGKPVYPVKPQPGMSEVIPFRAPVARAQPLEAVSKTG